MTDFLREGLRRLAHSLSARLLVIFVIATFVYGYAARYAFTLFQDTDYLRRIVGAHIVLHSDYILSDIGLPPNLERAQAIVDKIPVDLRIVGPGVDWSSSPDFYPLEEVPFGPLTFLELGEASREEVEAWAKDLDKVEIARHEEHTVVKLSDGPYDIVFASPRIREAPHPNYSAVVIYTFGALVLFACYLAVRWVFMPIRWMQEGAARIGQGDLDFRIPTRRHDELGDLSRDINDMADDVKGMLEAKRQLLLAISHELRSPLTRAKVAMEFIDDQKLRQAILEDLNEMEQLIADLLESEALNSRHAILRREIVDPGQLVESVVFSDFANRNDGIALHLDQNLPQAELDVTRMRLLLRNLIDNALRYNPAGAEPVEVRVRVVEGKLRIDVQDHGPGIPAEHVAHVTEPFYRADPARSRSTGGVGLGLYLCKRVAEVHGGSLSIVSSADSGTCVSAVLPLSGEPDA
jgi:signal transduction histidine kinase